MEAEKIKTIDEFLIEYMHHKPKVYNDGITERCYPVSAIIEMTEKYTSQFKQQPVVMPSDEEIEKEATSRVNYLSKKSGWRGFIEGGKWVIDRYLSLSKEAPKERIPDVGETIRETAIELCSCGASVSESYDGYCKDCG